MRLIEARATSADAQVRQQEAALDQARLNLDYADGQGAGRTGSSAAGRVEVGQVVQPGQPLMAITSLHDVWVTANFKETQLATMRPGQRAEVEVDAYGGRTYSGHVE